MALRLLRQTSDTPNITNKDDTKMIRYAYGGYNGVVKNFGKELNSIEPSSVGLFKIGSGKIVLQGWEADVDELGWELVNDGLSGEKYYSIYLEIDVILETAVIKSTHNTGSYPDINLGDDLTEIPNGTARLLLWKVRVNNGLVIESIKVVETIPYPKEQFKSLVDGSMIVGQSASLSNFYSGYPYFGENDLSKGWKLFAYCDIPEESTSLFGSVSATFLIDLHYGMSMQGIVKVSCRYASSKFDQPDISIIAGNDISSFVAYHVEDKRIGLYLVRPAGNDVHFSVTRLLNGHERPDIVLQLDNSNNWTMRDPDVKHIGNNMTAVYIPASSKITKEGLYAVVVRKPIGGGVYVNLSTLISIYDLNETNILTYIPVTEGGGCYTVRYLNGYITIKENDYDAYIYDIRLVAEY